MKIGQEYDPTWDQVYAQGFVQRWPWDCVVSFVFRHAPRDRPRAQVSVLELGFGSGANLWFAAREGFAVAGVEGSAQAVTQARARLAEEGLAGDLRQGDFTQPLPFGDAGFDLAIDRGSLTCVGHGAVRAAIAQVHRCLRPGGAFLFCPYSTDHPACGTGTPLGDGLETGFAQPGLAGLGAISFWDEAAVRAAFGAGWTLTQLVPLAGTDRIDPSQGRGEWHVVARKA